MASVGLVLGATAGTAAAVGTVAVIGGVGIAGSLIASNKARKQAAKARKVDQKRAQLSSARSAVEQVRQAQIARASVLQQGVNQGVGDSTAVAGGAGSISSQAGSNIAFAQRLFDLQNSARRLRESAFKFNGISSGISQLTSLAVNTVQAGGFGAGVPPAVEGGNNINTTVR